MLAAVASVLAISITFIAYNVSGAADMIMKNYLHDHGIMLADSISDTLWSKYSAEHGKSYTEYFDDKNLDEIDREVSPVLNATPVLKLKLYDSQGHLKYSSNLRDIINDDGDDLNVVNNRNMIAKSVVTTGAPFSSYRFRDIFYAGHSTYTDKYIFSAYVPIHEPGTKIPRGVVEVYYDISNMLAGYNKKKSLITISLIITGLLLFIFLSYLIIMNDRAVKKGSQEKEKYLDVLSDKNKALIEKSNELTELNKQLTGLKERAVKNSEEQTVFMHRMGHELRTPMNAVIGLTDLLLRTGITEKQRGYISAIQSSGNVLLDITDEILAVGRLEAGYLEIKNQRFIIANVLDSVLEVTGNRAYKKGIELYFKYTRDIYDEVEGDPVRLRQILINLVGNAIKYTDNGSVSIWVKHVSETSASQYYIFEVSDTGIGIEKEDYPRIFAAYCHLNSDGNMSNKSTGLGLSISKRLVESMNGVIGVTSKVDVGSVFSVKLPFVQCHQIAPAKTEQLENAKHSSKMLVVTDGYDTGTSIQLHILNSYGIKADRATSMTEAERYIEQSFMDLKPYTAFFIDSTVKGEEGMQLVRAIRSQPAFDDSYIVLMIPITTSLEKNTVSKTDKMLCINKPITTTAFNNIMQRLLEGRSHYLSKSLPILPLMQMEPVEPDCDDCPSVDAKIHNVLVVDDNPINRELMLEMLSGLRVTARAVVDGQSTIEACMEEDFDLILLDCHLPDIDGYDITAKIRRMKDKSRQPVIIISSSDSSLRNKQLCFESGADDFLKMPVTVSSLVFTLSSWLPEITYTEIQSQPDQDTSVINLFSANVIDQGVMSELKRRDNDNPGFLEKIIELFINDCFERIETMKNHLENSNFTGIERIAHSIKSACLHMGAMRMARYCEVLGNTARNQTHNETSRALQYFSEEFDRVLLELNKERELATESL